METAREQTTVGLLYKWVILVCASLGLFLGALDITVNVALPNITDYFATDLQTIQWIIIAYLTTSTGLQISLGSAADIYGLKRFYVIGIAFYTAAVALIGLAPSLPLILILRVAQAVGAGMIAGTVPALVTRAFPASERGKGLGFMAAFGTLGMIAATLGGGVLVDAFGWRAIFLWRVPIGISIILLAIFVLPNQKSTTQRKSFDMPGAIALFIGLAGLLMALNLVGRLGWTSPAVVIFGIVSFAALSLFIYLEKRASFPVLDLSLLKRRSLTIALLVVYLFSLGQFVNLFILPFYVSDTLGQQASVLGLLLALRAIVGSIVSPASGWLSDRVPPPYLITLALIIASLAMTWFTVLDATSGVADVAVRLAIMGLGFGIFQAASATLVMGGVPSQRLATGAALMSLCRTMGSVSSVAIATFIFSTRFDAHTLTLAQQGLTGDAGSAQAFVLAFQDAYRFSALVLGLGVAVSFLAWSRRGTRQN